jgi:hypothetical protein
MASISVTSFLCGAALGLRFRVMALLPALLIEILVITTLGIWLGHGHQWIVAGNLVGLVCLQLGYVGGTLPRFLLIYARIGNSEPEPLANRWLPNK